MNSDGKFSILERYGEVFTDKEYVTNPAIGRDEEIKQLILILLTPEKSAILVGKPGIGKTAIVEGLSYAIQRGNVPDALKGYSIINIKTASLLGTMPNGDSKVQLLIDELKTKERLILFIDEVHMLIGATDESAVDFANIFKEGLGRGSIKVIGATTTEEYERYILRDKAFTRRFQRVEVEEPTRDETVQILIGTLPKIEKETGVRMKYSAYQQELIFGFIVDMTSEYKRVYEIGSRYPDISLTIVKSAFSFTVFDNRREVSIYDFEKAIKNTHLVYPDVINKELPKFKEMFKDIYDEEVDPNKASEITLQEPTLDIEENKNIPVAAEEVAMPDRRKENSIYSAPTTMEEMDTRDERVEPARIQVSEMNANVLGNVEDSPLDLDDEDSDEDYMEEDFPADENLDDNNIQATPALNNLYEVPVKITNMGTRDTKVAPTRMSYQPFDNMLVGNQNQPISDAPVNENQVLVEQNNIKQVLPDLNLELNNDEDDLEDTEDDFYE